jgi:hypothetical protein
VIELAAGTVAGVVVFIGAQSLFGGPAPSAAVRSLGAARRDSQGASR